LILESILSWDLMDEEGFLFDWTRHYASLVLLMLFAGIVAALLYVRIVPPKQEAWTILVESPTAGITPRQLGPVADAIFHSEAVYLPVMQQLRIRESPQRFLGRSVDLLPIPDSRFLIVVGRSGDPQRAAQISEAMAQSLLKAFKDRGISEFLTFDRSHPATVRSGLPPPLAAALGGSIGMWLGLAFSLFHYRVRRPVLSFRRALALAGTDWAAVVPGRPPPWLGVLRRRPRWLDTVPNQARLTSLLSNDRSVPRVVVPGARRKWEALLLQQFVQAIRTQAPDLSLREDKGSAAVPARDGTVYVCSASTAERDVYFAGTELRPTADKGPSERRVLWIR
jgi:hypothetical protein